MKIRKSLLIGIVITIVLLGGLLLALYLNQRQQEIRQRAAEPTPTPVFGQAAVFNGVDTQVYIGSGSASTTLPLSHLPFTVEMWAKPEYLAPEPESPVRYLLDTNVKSQTTECNDLFSIYISPVDQAGTKYTVASKFITAADQQTTLGKSEITLPYNEWAYIAVSVDASGSARLLLNGKVVDETTITPDFCLDQDNWFYLGSGAWPHTSTHYKGQIDDLSFSNIARYQDTAPTPEGPQTVTQDTTALFHFDGNLKDEFTGKDATGGPVTYVPSTIKETTAPACQANISTCAWDPVDTAVSYHYIITESESTTPIAEGDVNAPTTSVTFTSEANKTYTCGVTATNACGATGDKGSATATCSVPTPTPLPSDTPTPTETPIPSSTPTNTPIPSATPTSTPTPTKPPVPTSTPTNTPTPLATNTPRPTATPTNTPTPTIPGQPTDTPTPTLASPGSTAQTVTIAGAVLLTILGAVILFVL